MVTSGSLKSSGFWSASSHGLNLLFLRLRYAHPASLAPSLGWGEGALGWFDAVDVPAVRQPASGWRFCQRDASMHGPQAFRFFGVEHTLADNRGWRWKPWGEDWLLNLHAFDDLLADDRQARFEWHEKLISNWIMANPPGKGVGWQPTSLSRRISNWIKWGLATQGLNDVARSSLVVQARFLRKRMGSSVTGLYAGRAGMALLFAGAFFEGSEADGWRRIGVSVLRNMLKSRCFEGGQDAPPAFNAGALEGLLDLVQLDKIYPGLLPLDEVNRWQMAALELLAHGEAPAAGPDAAGRAVLFDAPSWQALRSYARELGVLSGN
ncbi:hypothetical protein PIGHUM_04633 [Pigmentiphaga humi]|uniref:Heparinase II/III-like protein n=1 Tax=Pigmentiphaga humi TaxID=2478468 RepID=A0A3P4B982_9BURK|nr:hypothetical protein [Pigmentiphaga humi]VCU72531.1 hypothetical protein PIGHUM_04633 [Pigmentiphaga humi]